MGPETYHIDPEKAFTFSENKKPKPAPGKKRAGKLAAMAALGAAALSPQAAEAGDWAGRVIEGGQVVGRTVEVIHTNRTQKKISEQQEETQKEISKNQKEIENQRNKSYENVETKRIDANKEVENNRNITEQNRDTQREMTERERVKAQQSMHEISAAVEASKNAAEAGVSEVDTMAKDGKLKVNIKKPTPTAAGMKMVEILDK
jgi:hypothetical protein